MSDYTASPTFREDPKPEHASDAVLVPNGDSAECEQGHLFPLCPALPRQANTRVLDPYIDNGPAASQSSRSPHPSASLQRILLSPNSAKAEPLPRSETVNMELFGQVIGVGDGRVPCCVF